MDATNPITLPLTAAQVSWTEERVEQLKSLWDRGFSCSMISVEMGVTRNAVIGKVTRLRLPKRMIIHRSQYKRAGRVIKEKVPRAKPKPRSSYSYLSVHSRAQRLVRSRLIMTELVALGEACDLPPYQSPFAATLVDLSADQCRFPVDAPPWSTTSMQYFCGDRIVKNCSYCEQHKRLAYRGPFRSIGEVASCVVENLEAQRRNNGPTP